MPTMSRLAACAALTLGLGACGTGGDADPGPQRSPVATASTTAGTTSTYADLEEARFETDGADGMVAAEGSLWVKTDVGHVLRIDPRTNRVTADVVVDKRTGQGFYCQGIGAVSGSVWSCATRVGGIGVAQIDPSSNRVVRVVPVGKIFDQLALPATDRGVWVLTGDGSTVSVVDAVSGKVTSYPLDARCQQLAASGDRVVATSAVEDTVVVLDAGSGEVLQRLDVPDARMAAVVGDEVWVDSSDGLTRFTDDLASRTVYPGLVATAGGDLSSDGTDVWVRGSDGVITQVDAATGEVLERITPVTSLSAGSVVAAYGSVWTTDSEAGSVIRLRAD